MFIPVCSMAAFNFSTAHKNVTHFCLNKGLLLAFVATNLLATYVIWKLLKCLFQWPKKFFTHCDKNIKIRAEFVMFTLVCSIAAFNISTAKCNVNSYIKSRTLFLAFVPKNLFPTYVIRKLLKCRFQWPKVFWTHCDKNIKIRAEVVMFGSSIRSRPSIFRQLNVM